MAQPKPIADKDTVIKKSAKLLSLDDMDSASHNTPGVLKKEEDNPITVSANVKEFNQENVAELWNSFANSIKDTKGGVAVLMNMNLPQVTDGATITVNLESELQQNQLMQVITALKNFIYSHVGFHPHIQVNVVKSKDSAVKYYTPQDKLKRLIELNPFLKRFQKELGLDLDYD